jgi:hypothetical protein
LIKRVVLFLITNLAVVFVLSITMRLLGVDRIPPKPAADSI